MPYEFTIENLKNNVSKPKVIHKFWFTLCFAFFFAGIFISSQYYQDRCNSFIIDNFLDPSSEFRKDNPMFMDLHNFSMPNFENETRLSPIKQITNKIT